MKLRYGSLLVIAALAAACGDAAAPTADRQENLAVLTRAPTDCSKLPTKDAPGYVQLGMRRELVDASIECLGEIDHRNYQVRNQGYTQRGENGEFIAMVSRNGVFETQQISATAGGRPYAGRFLELILSGQPHDQRVISTSFGERFSARRYFPTQPALMAQMEASLGKLSLVSQSHNTLTYASVAAPPARANAPTAATCMERGQFPIECGRTVVLTLQLADPDKTVQSYNVLLRNPLATRKQIDSAPEPVFKRDLTSLTKVLAGVPDAVNLRFCEAADYRVQSRYQELVQTGAIKSEEQREVAAAIRARKWHRDEAMKRLGLSTDDFALPNETRNRIVDNKRPIDGEIIAMVKACDRLLGGEVHKLLRPL